MAKLLLDVQLVEQQLCCPICSQLSASPFSTTCGHVMCGHCLLVWIKHHSTCPLCRAELAAAPARCFPLEQFITSLLAQLHSLQDVASDFQLGCDQYGADKPSSAQLADLLKAAFRSPATSSAAADRDTLPRHTTRDAWLRTRRQTDHMDAINTPLDSRDAFWSDDALALRQSAALPASDVDEDELEDGHGDSPPRSISRFSPTSPAVSHGPAPLTATDVSHRRDSLALHLAARPALRGDWSATGAVDRRRRFYAPPPPSPLRPRPSTSTV